MPNTIDHFLTFPGVTAFVPMADHTSLKIGGKADLMATPASEGELIALLKAAKDSNLPVTIIGKGSNLLVLDGGIRGLVIKIEAPMSEIAVDGETLVAAGGAAMAAAAQMALHASLTGLEFISGIPGTVGGGVFMNAGAYEGEMKNVVTKVRGVTREGEPFTYSNADMAFGYRKSIAQARGLIITGVHFALKKGDSEAIALKMKDFNERRRQKQPLTERSCGSTFKRPEGHYAGTLIESCGLKGARVGPCQVSEIHAGFLINHEGGTAKDYLGLIALVQKTVFEKTGVLLEPEVRIVGEESPIHAV